MVMFTCPPLRRSVFKASAEQHLAQLCLQLLQAEGVQQAEVWLPVVARLAWSAATAVSPSHMVAMNQADPRMHVKVGWVGRVRAPGFARPCRHKGLAQLAISVERQLAVENAFM